MGNAHSTLEKDRQFYVYVLFRENGTPFYIGKGKGRRWLLHEWEAKRGFRSRKANIIRRMMRADMDIPKVKIRVGLTENEAYDIEKALILAVGFGPGGLLANMNDGRGGPSNPSPESRAKMSVAAKRYAATHGPLHAKPHSTETRLLLAEKSRGNTSHLGHKHSDEVRAKMRKAWERRRMVAPNRHGADGRFQPSTQS